MEMRGDTSFGQWLKKRRKALDLTQQELARRVGCAVITIEKIEANERRPSKQMAGLLAEHLGIAPDERPTFVRFARMGAGAPWSAMSAQAAHRVLWSLSPRHLTNLPAQPTPLIGRDQDVTAVRKRLVGDDTRLVTLVGPPGVGKTRLAIQVAAGLLDDFGDGVYFVALAPVGDPNQVAAAIAQTLGVNETADRSFADRLKEYLRDKHMLLVLDNFEQVLTAAPFVSDLLAECPWLSIMVTSRAPLRVRRERQFPVPLLAFPSGADAGFDPAELMRYSAIALFVERAQAVRPDFSLSADNAAATPAICARLDGLPLAIELVAAWTKVLPPQTLLERLRERLMLHTDGLRDFSERHRTLYNAIDWSYALLRPEEQLLLARSGVFIGGWTLEAAEKLMSDIAHNPSLVTLEALTSLVNNNLVVQQEQSGKPRFTLLETVRAYALERLAERGEEEAIRQRHAEYYLALAEEADPHLRTAAQQAWLDRLDVESGNLRAALAWFIEGAVDAEAGLRLAGALGWFWTIRGHVSEGRDWSARALQRGSDAPPALRAKVLFRAGALAWPGDLPAARSLLEESIALYRELGPSQEWELAWALTAFALVMTYQTDYDLVQSAGEEALALFRQARDKWGVALALSVVGQAYLLRHDYIGACSRFEEGLALFRETGDKWGISIPLSNWGYTDSLQGNLDAARARLEECIAMHRQIGERVIRSLFLNILAQVVQQQGDYQQAAALYDESLDLLRKMGLEASIADVLHNLAHLAQAQGHYQLAENLYQESLALFSKQGNEQGVAKCRAGLAAVAGVGEKVERGI
jgi:predicted ATPase/transcriptional regulator with XRE-family HTH domain